MHFQLICSIQYKLVIRKFQAKNEVDTTSNQSDGIRQIFQDLIILTYCEFNKS